MPNPLRFLPEEAMLAKSLNRLPPIMHIGVTPIYYKVALIRLLTGTLNIRCNLNNKVIKQRVNYSQLLYSQNRRISSNTIKKAIQPFKLKDLSSHLLSNRSKNFNFYKELFVEFSNYFLRKDENNHIAAFLHLYRILESIAYCFPLIWAARASDYVGTYNQLKTYFDGPKTGELKFFKRFIDDVLEETLQNTQVTLYINSVHPDWQKKYYQSINRNIPQNDVVSYTEYSEITVKFCCITELVINLRNQYFHFLTGNGNNFNSDDIAESNEFFNIINEVATNWLAVIFFEILEYEMTL
jgi:hypothetical protein